MDAAARGTPDTSALDTDTADDASEDSVGGDSRTDSSLGEPDGSHAGVPCTVAACKEGVARTCGDGPALLVECAAYGGKCAGFKHPESGADFRWCDCGTLESARCLGGQEGLTCSGDFLSLIDCGPGRRCVEREGSALGIGCECNNVADGLCPGRDCKEDPDCDTCVPDCEGKDCGDNGCGGECDRCGLGSRCSASQRCEPICVPSCDGRKCGPDGCGDTCGECDGTCNAAGKCQGRCVPKCSSGQQCGSDRCGGTCGPGCPKDRECRSDKLRCDCPFFDRIGYSIALDAKGDFSDISFVTVNVWHRELDGKEQPSKGETFCKREGCSKNFGAGPWEPQYYGCEPNLRISVDAAFVGGRVSCELDVVVKDRKTIVIPAPVKDDESCKFPPLK